MSLIWGNADQHNRAFQKALAEYREEWPLDFRPFHELEPDSRSAILARQVIIYRELKGK